MRTEERILSTVDHPFLATLYGTLQTGERRVCAGGERGLVAAVRALHIKKP